MVNKRRRSRAESSLLRKSFHGKSKSNYKLNISLDARYQLPAPFGVVRAYSASCSALFGGPSYEELRCGKIGSKMYVARAGLVLFKQGTEPIHLDVDMLRVFQNPEWDIAQEKKTWYLGAPFVMEIEYESTAEDRCRIAIDVCEKALTILRLFKEGYIWVSSVERIWDKKDGPEKGTHGAAIYEALAFGNWFSRVGGSTGSLARMRSPYSISKREIPRLEHHLRELMPLDMGFCSIAVQRFNSSYQRANQPDRLLDLLIAFEALLSDDSQAVGYKIALRCVKLLGEPLPQMEDDFKFLKRVYNARSKIVHGTLGDTTEEDCDRAESLLRRTILRLLHLWKDGKKVDSTNIDTSLFFSSGST